MASTETRDQLEGEPPIPTETEPLLGRPGDAIQKPNQPMIRNLYLGTGWLAQVGSILLLALVWAGVFLHPLLPLVSPHPLLQSLGVFTLTQSILVLQPTNTTEAKVLGARAHAALNLLSLALFAAGVAVIETNKETSGSPHFHSVHGYLGVVAGVAVLFQSAFGFLMWAAPAALGGVDSAKALWKYHRWSGYAVFVLLLAAVVSATETPYNDAVLNIKEWSVAVAVVLIILGVFPRIQLFKLGFRRAH